MANLGEQVGWQEPGREQRHHFGVQGRLQAHRASGRQTRQSVRVGAIIGIIYGGAALCRVLYLL